jgi:vacuolar-type H+-ATPase subunit H
MYDELPKESARQRAQRIWRNNHIQKWAKYPEQIDSTIIEDEKRSNQIMARINRSIREVLTESNHTKAVSYYMELIRLRKRRLLKEKLRRLESQHE